MKMEYVLTGAEMASCDAATSEVIGIPSLVLMERAALSVADGVDVFLRKYFTRISGGRGPVVLAAAGRGNNGADALAAGRILLDRGYDVRFCRLSGKISPESSPSTGAERSAHLSCGALRSAITLSYSRRCC